MTLTAYQTNRSAVAITTTVEAGRRGGWSINDLSQLPFGIFSVVLSSRAVNASQASQFKGIVASLSHYEEVRGTGFAVLGDQGSTVGAIPSFATSPALILVGGLMLTGLGQIEWTDPAIAIPAFLTVTTIPMTWSIADGLSFGLTSYAAIELLTGRFRRANWMLYLLAVLFLMRFFLLHRQ